MNIVRLGFLVVLMSFNAHAMAGCSKDALYAGCPWDGGRIAAHGGQFSVEKMPKEAAAGLLERYNHTPNGCGHPADHVIGAYSRYTDGKLFYLHGNILEQAHTIDRVMLRDLLDNKIVIDNSKIKLMSCKEADSYKPTKQTYSMPSFESDLNR
jgi:hypothetical protein